MADGDNPNSTIFIVTCSKVVKATLVGPVGMLVYDVTAGKLSVKTNAGTAIGSWELVTSVADA